MRTAEIVALTFSLAATVIALVSVRYTRQQAATARAADRRARTPRLRVQLVEGPRIDLSETYELLNEGPQDLGCMAALVKVAAPHNVIVGDAQADPLAPGPISATMRQVLLAHRPLAKPVFA